MKIRPIRAEVYHADRPTDMTHLTVAFRNFTNAPETYGLGVPSIRVVFLQSFVKICQVVKRLNGGTQRGSHNPTLFSLSLRN
jgi:hypothetical protein